MELLNYTFYYYLVYIAYVAPRNIWTFMPHLRMHECYCIATMQSNAISFMHFKFDLSVQILYIYCVDLDYRPP